LNLVELDFSGNEMNGHHLKILGVIALIIALSMIPSMSLSQRQSQAAALTIEEQSPVEQQQGPSEEKATATITITMTGIAGDEER
jgi:hypothetical protein